MFHEPPIEGRGRGPCSPLAGEGFCTTVVSRYDHEILKEILSSSDAVGPRSACRAAFEARALAGDDEVRDLLEAEAAVRGGLRDEPQSLPSRRFIGPSCG